MGGGGAQTCCSRGSGRRPSANRGRGDRGGRTRGRGQPPPPVRPPNRRAGGGGRLSAVERETEGGCAGAGGGGPQGRCLTSDGALDSRTAPVERRGPGSPRVSRGVSGPPAAQRAAAAGPSATAPARTGRSRGGARGTGRRSRGRRVLAVGERVQWPCGRLQSGCEGVGGRTEAVLGGGPDGHPPKAGWRGGGGAQRPLSSAGALRHWGPPPLRPRDRHARPQGPVLPLAPPHT